MDTENSNEPRSHVKNSYLLYLFFIWAMYYCMVLNTKEDPENSNEQRFYIKTSCRLYWLFMSTIFFLLYQLGYNLTEKSSNVIGIAFLLYFINFFLVAYAPDQNIPMVFYIIFYATMISASGFQLYYLEHLHQQLKAYEDYLPL